MIKKTYLLFIGLLILIVSCQTVKSNSLPLWAITDDLNCPGYVFFSASIKTGSSNPEINEDLAVKFIAKKIISTMQIKDDSPIYDDIFENVLSTIDVHIVKNYNSIHNEIKNNSKKSSFNNKSLYEFVNFKNDKELINTIKFHYSGDSSSGVFISILLVYNEENYNKLSSFYKFANQIILDPLSKSFNNIKKIVSQTNEFIESIDDNDLIIASKIFNKINLELQNLTLSLKNNKLSIKLNDTVNYSFSGSTEFLNLPISVSVYDADKEVDNFIKSKTISSDENGNFRYIVENISKKGNYSVVFKPSLDEALPISSQAYPAIEKHIKELKDLINKKTVRAGYDVFSNAARLKTAILIYDLDRAGNRLFTHETANGLEMYLQAEGFDIEVVTLSDDLSKVSVEEFTRVAVENFGNDFDRVIIGVSSLSDYSANGLQVSLGVKGHVLVYDCKEEKTIYRLEESTNSRSNDLNAAVMLAYRGLGRLYGQNFLNSLP